MKAKTIIRKAKNKENPYSMISKTAVRDDRLSWKATGLLAFILSLPDDWQIYVLDLANRKQDGLAATRSALKELVEVGYMEKKSYRDKKGHFVKHEYILHEAPLSTIHLSTSGILDATKYCTKLSNDSEKKDPKWYTDAITRKLADSVEIPDETKKHTLQ